MFERINKVVFYFYLLSYACIAQVITVLFNISLCLLICAPIKPHCKGKQKILQVMHSTESMLSSDIKVP